MVHGFELRGIGLTFELAEGPYKFDPPTMKFEQYLEDGAYDRLPTLLSTCVHELGHGYGARMAFQLMVDRGEPHGDGGEAILVDGEPWLVRHTPTFPAEDMDSTFPSDARTFKYGVYIAGEQSAGSTQMFGAYGLLDEYAALLGRFVAWAEQQGLRDWTAVQLPHLTAFLQHERERPLADEPKESTKRLSSESVYLEIAALRAFYRFAENEKLLPVNVAENLSLPRRWKR